MKNKNKIPPVRALSMGYAITILAGTILLLLPISTRSGETTKFIDALFTATSATCVTGLIPFDTFTHWTLFGQIVILFLIQIGGLGFMTILTIIFMIFKRNISLYNRTILMQSAGTYNISEVTKLIKRIIVGTLLIEAVGATILSLEFAKTLSTPRAIYYGIFHSVSAFCNAGFDILGSSTGSLTQYFNNEVILITIMVLIVIGGLGFIVWSDLMDCKFKFNKLQLHSKIVLTGTLALIIIPAILFYIVEFTSFGNQGNFQHLEFTDKLLNSFFLSISPRTAGFITLDLTQLTSSGKLLTIILMFIGGNSGSTAGGIKVTTFIIVLVSLLASARGNRKVRLFKRRVPSKVVTQAGSLFVAYMLMIIMASLIITSIEQFTFEQVLFEVVSAIGTVGLSLGVSASAGVITKLVLILLMYTGRLGALALLAVFVTEKNENIIEEPKGRILVG